MNEGMRRDNQSAPRSIAKCPRCAGRMIYPRDLAGVGDRVVISRRCPDCQQCDVILTTRLPAMVWFARTRASARRWQRCATHSLMGFRSSSSSRRSQA